MFCGFVMQLFAFRPFFSVMFLQLDVLKLDLVYNSQERLWVSTFIIFLIAQIVFLCFKPANDCNEGDFSLFVDLFLAWVQARKNLSMGSIDYSIEEE
jgi:hypothetical protein